MYASNVFFTQTFYLTYVKDKMVSYKIGFLLTHFFLSILNILVNKLGHISTSLQLVNYCKTLYSHLF